MKFKLLIALFITILTFSKVSANEGDTDISVFTGTFDVIDKEVMMKLLYLVLNTKIQIYLEILF